MGRLNTIAFLICTVGICETARAEEPLKVGIYRGGLGGPAVCKALAKQKGLEATLVKSLKTEELLAFDAAFIGAVKMNRPDELKALRVFVACGGGLVLNHSSCGRGKPETLFPEIVKKVSNRREDTILVVGEAEHPLVLGLPEEIEHAYYDHLLMEPGPAGVVLVRDREDDPVVVIGMAGAGRVVFNGSVPGYRYDAATYHQGEAEPTGGELQLVINALKWAGASRISGRPKEETAKLLQQFGDAASLEEMRKLLPTSAWYGQEMLRGSYLPRRPVNELGGRFFITYDAQTWRGYFLKRTRTEEQKRYFRQRLKLDVQHLKWLGVTDIVYWTDVSGERVDRLTEVPDSARRYAAIDPLEMLAELTEEAGLSVWAAWHSCSRSEKFAQKYCAKDAQGKLYMYGTRDYIEDLVGTAYRERCRAFLDEYATKYKKHKSFKGLAIYDEIWFVYPEFFEDDLPVFDKFCKERFGEPLPEDISERLAKHRRWIDTSDVWRRRFILFKQHVLTDFWRFMVDEAHQRGLQIGTELQDSSHYASGWCWGIDSVELARAGGDFLIASGGKTAAQCYPNTYRWAHVHDSWGRYNTHCLRGGPGGIFFTFNQLWRLIMYANNPKLTHQIARHIHNQRQWANAESLTRVAVLHQQNVLQMLEADPRPHTIRSYSLMKTISHSQPADTIFTRAHELYPNYRVLVAMPYSVRGLAAEVLDKLKEFVQGGGTIISVNADWSLSRPDLTDERSVTAEMVGVTYGEQLPQAAAKLTVDKVSILLQETTPRRAVSSSEGTTTLASFEGDGGPAVTEKQIGKGKVVGLHFAAGVELERAENPELIAYLSAMIRKASRAEVFAEGSGFLVMSALKKGNWVAVSLFPEEVPATPRVTVDLKALGIEKDGFRMLMLGKEMEVGLPGDTWGEKGHWKAADLKRGFPVTIVADHDRVRPLPEKFDLSTFNEWSQGYIDLVTRKDWDSIAKGKRKRTYAHEIVVLGPGDEPVMPE